MVVRLAYVMGDMFLKLEDQVSSPNSPSLCVIYVPIMDVGLQCMELLQCDLLGRYDT